MVNEILSDEYMIVPQIANYLNEDINTISQLINRHKKEFADGEIITVKLNELQDYKISHSYGFNDMRIAGGNRIIISKEGILKVKSMINQLNITNEKIELIENLSEEDVRISLSNLEFDRYLPDGKILVKDACSFFNIDSHRVFGSFTGKKNPVKKECFTMNVKESNDYKCHMRMSFGVNISYSALSFVTERGVLKIIAMMGKHEILEKAFSKNISFENTSKEINKQQKIHETSSPIKSNNECEQNVLLEKIEKLEMMLEVCLSNQDKLLKIVSDQKNDSNLKMNNSNNVIIDKLGNVTYL